MHWFQFLLDAAPMLLTNRFVIGTIGALLQSTAIADPGKVAREGAWGGLWGNIATELAKWVIGRAAKYVTGSAQQRALQRVLSAAFTALLEQGAIDGTEQDVRRLEKAIKDFLQHEGHVRQLVELALDLSGDHLNEEQWRALRQLFANASLPAATAQAGPEQLLAAFLAGFLMGLHREAEQPDSPLTNVATLGYLRSLLEIAHRPQRQREEAIERYMAALAKLCDRLPYASLVPEWPQSASLSILHIAQHLEQIGDHDPADPTTTTPEEALRRHPHLVIEGPAGLGKSTLLRHICLESVALRRQEPLQDVPVLVSARDLAGTRDSLSRNLRQQAERFLASTLDLALPEDLFDSAPSPGTRWLVLIDGFDEVLPAAKRVQLATWIKDHAEHQHFRFVVTSRPVPELPLLGHGGAARFRLLPLNPQMLPVFAEKWFAHSPRNLAGDADRFLQRVAESDLTELATSPLLLTMAAVVYEQDREQPLPITRASLYTRFIDLIARIAEGERAMPALFQSEAIAAIGTRAADHMEDVIYELPTLLEALALAQLQQSGNLVDTALALAMKQLGTLKPREAAWLKDHMPELLVRTGVIVDRGERLDFLHPTFQEFLAARHLATQYQPDTEQGRSQITERWWQPDWRGVTLFLLGIWSDQGAEVETLLLPIADYATAGVLYTAEALAAGVRASNLPMLIPRTLSYHASSPLCSYAEQAIAALGSLRSFPEAAAFLMEIVKTPVYPARLRVRSAEALGQGVTPEVLTNIRAIAADPLEGALSRCEAAAAAMRLGDQTASDLLENLGKDPGTPAMARIKAIDLLLMAGCDREALAVVGVLRDDPTVPHVLCRQVARVLEGTGYLKDAQQYVSEVENAYTPDHPGRLHAARGWLILGDSERARRIVGDLQAHWPKPTFQDRTNAAEVSAALQEPAMAADQMQQLFGEAETAAEKLAVLEAMSRSGLSSRAVPLLERLSGSLPPSSEERLKLAELALSLGRPDVADSLLREAAAQQDEPLIAIQAVERLALLSSRPGDLEPLRLAYAVLKRHIAHPARRPVVALHAARSAARLGFRQDAHAILEVLTEETQCAWTVRRDALYAWLGVFPDMRVAEYAATIAKAASPGIPLAALFSHPQMLMLSRMAAALTLAAPAAEVGATYPVENRRALLRTEATFRILSLQYDAALDCCEEWAAIDPANPAAWCRLGEMHALHGHPRETQDSYQKASQLSPEDPMIAYQLGMACLWNGDHTGANVSLRRSLEQGDTFPACMGMMLLALAAGDEAYTIWGVRAVAQSTLRAPVTTLREHMELQAVHWLCRGNQPMALEALYWARLLSAGRAPGALPVWQILRSLPSPPKGLDLVWQALYPATA